MSEDEDQMRHHLLELLTAALLLGALVGCSDDSAPSKDAGDAGPADVLTIEGPRTIPVSDLNLNLEQWIPISDAATDLAAATADGQP